jgi:dTDP-4-amino-4,6-dideoxygalactose transaminase
MIPMCDLKRQYTTLKPAIDAALQEAAAGGAYILGPQVRQFEREVAAFCGCRHAVGVGNGTDALHLALRALDIGPGDEVITTPLTFVATAEAISLVGAKVVLVDVDRHTFNIDPARVEAAITPRTKAILPVHLYGQPCDMDALAEIALRRRLHLVEDCAQAMGATWRGRRAGTFGDAGCISLFPSKNLGALGDGGLIVTNRDDLAERVEALRRHGCRAKYFQDELGLNSRLDELQAAVLRVKLPHLERWNRERRRLACRYNDLLAGIPGLELPRENYGGAFVVPSLAAGNAENPLLEAVYHQYTIRLDDRDRLAARLAERKIASAIYYPVLIHLQKAYASLGLATGSFPNAEAACRRCLSLPMFPELTEREQEEVARVVREFGEGSATATRRKSA